MYHSDYGAATRHPRASQGLRRPAEATPSAYPATYDTSVKAGYQLWQPTEAAAYTHPSYTAIITPEGCTLRRTWCRQRPAATARSGKASAPGGTANGEARGCPKPHPPHQTGRPSPATYGRQTAAGTIGPAPS